MTIFSKAHQILRNLVIKEVSSVDRGAGEGVRVMLSKRDKTVPAAVVAYRKRVDAARGIFPIEKAADLDLAVQAYRFVEKSELAAVKKEIIARARVLKLELPDAWKIKKADFLTAIEAPIAKVFADMEPDGRAALAGAIAKDVGDGDPEEAVLFDEALKAKEVTQEFNQEFWEATDTLRDSITSILCDESADRAKMIEQTLKEFSDHLAGVLPAEMKKALAAGFAADAGGARTDGVEKMLVEIAKKLGLPATATEAEILKAMDDKAKKDKEDADKKVEKLDDAELAYMAKMAPTGREAFQKMSAADRAKKMKEEPAEDDEDKVAKALKSGDAFKAEDGTVLTKRDFPTENGYNFAKSQAAKIASQAADILKRDEAAEVVAFGKRATDLGFTEDFGETLRKAYKGDAAAITKLESEMKALREQARVGKLFDEHGSNQGGASGSKGFDQLMAKAAELKKADPKLTIEQAFSKAYEDPANHEVVKLYKRETSSAAA